MCVSHLGSRCAGALGQCTWGALEKGHPKLGAAGVFSQSNGGRWVFLACATG